MIGAGLGVVAIPADSTPTGLPQRLCSSAGPPPGMFMKSVVLAAAPLIAAATAAHADHDVFTDMLKHPRSEDVLNADAAQCREQTGQSNFNGSPMLPSYLRCMRARSWRFDSTAVSRDYHHRWIVPGVTWTDPDRPGTCHYILGGLGSECSNY